MKIDCTHERQTYFDTMLPCPRVGCDYGTRAPTYSMAVRSREPVATYVKLTFQRNFDNGHWTPIPCIDAHADQALTEKLTDAGLWGALIYGKAKPPEATANLHGLGAWQPEAPSESPIVKAIAKVREKIAKAQADCMKAAYEPQFMMTEAEAESFADVCRDKAPHLSAGGRMEEVEYLLNRGHIDKATASRLLEAPRFVAEHKTLRAPRAQSLGQPLSCLQAIQARKPPGPWRPSVDEWDLLPDAGSR